MKRIIKIIVKRKLYFPNRLFNFLYYNLCIAKREKRKFIFVTPKSIFDIHKSASLKIKSEVIFGWCNMKYSNLETALCMGEKAEFILGGGKNIRQIQIGYGSYIQVGAYAKLHIGDSFINREVKIICNNSISIGNDCIIAMGVIIRDNDGGNHKILSSDYKNSKPVEIQNHVWLGENVMILKGVTIGEGAIIAANSLVTKDIPPHCLAGGSPAKVIRENVQWEA